ncbi:hypothetical protein SKAU_G00059350 [Synaphobranchus kaupii]|uniref:DUF3715 domain-containing protein n=1 Tax=Synaphobranchus kaupii TaxID=118154 RepID=A0A9Q1G4Q2_SYNKA|nr:hypothetical protein SKAU_G00059350 [Synaphobranchus kaupii]
MAGVSGVKEKLTTELNRSSIGEVVAESCDILKPRSISEAAYQDGEEAEHGGLVTSEQEAAEWLKAGMWERSLSTSHSAQRQAEDVRLTNFHIPRKNKEQKALFQYFPGESREFEDIVRIVSTSYLESSSMGTFSYAKARLVHSELLEKSFCEKRRELKLEGRTERELQESYCFLLTNSAKLPDICGKGLHVGHSRLAMQGNPIFGVSVSRFSDLLQINPFDVGASGEIIIFKVIKGKVKNIFHKKAKGPLDPSPGFDCHLSKKASGVTSLLSYRAFEITQQYFYEYNFDSIRERPRHVCPYAVVSFLFKGRQAAPPPPKPATPIRSIGRSSVASGVRSRFAVWSGQLQNRVQLVSEVSLCSSCCAFLPVKLPEILEMHTAMHLDQVKQKIPSALLSLNTYGKNSEVMQSGLYCSLYEVESRGRGVLTDLMIALEREGMVLVKPLIDGGFLFLLSSAQMVHPEGRCGGWVWRLQALFIFQESRGVTRLSSAPLMERSLGSEVMRGLDSFLPALHYAQLKLRTCNPSNLAVGVERQACDYLYRHGRGKLRPFYLSEYQHNLDGLEKLYPAPRRVLNLDRRLKAYLGRPSTYALPLSHAQQMVKRLVRPPRRPRERSPERDVGGATEQEVGPQGCGLSQDEYDPTMMNKLLRIIKCKKNQGVEPEAQGVEPDAPGVEPEAQEVEPGKEEEEELTNEPGLKRKCEGESTETHSKCLRRNSESNTDMRVEGFHSPEDPDPSTAIPSRRRMARRPRSEGADGMVEAEADVGGASPCGLDCVLDEELGRFSVKMRDVLRGEGVWYRSERARSRSRTALHGRAFSDRVSQHASPAFVRHYVSKLWEGMIRVIGSQPAPPPCAAPPISPPAATPRGGVRETEAVYVIRADNLLDQLTTQRATPLGEGCPVLDSAPGPTPASFSLIGQMKALDAIRHLQDNVRFYIHPGAQPESHNQGKIKEYLKSLGKEECDPQMFLKRQPSGAERLLVVIENQDIATHLHKVPGLVLLKKQGTRVSFAGVDGPEDLRNCTYNELLVSGGFLVSDDFLLSPDFITHERLQELLTSLEGRSSPENIWCWKIHCKTKKKLKEIGRSNSEALLLFNLLCSYQKRRLVEFLPYHECDASSRPAPDLSCLIHLQAQNTQQRHAIFLTERRAEMFPGYSANGIVIASIDDVTNRFEILVGTCEKKAEPPISPPPPPPVDHFPPPTAPQVPATPCSSDPGRGLDFDALKSAISQFRAYRHVTGQLSDLELGVASTFDPYQSFLNPNSLWTPPSGDWGTLGRSSSTPSSSQAWGCGSVPSHFLFGHQGSDSPTCSPTPAPPPSSLGPAHLDKKGW